MILINKSGRIKKYISLLLVMAIAFTSIPISHVSAAVDTVDIEEFLEGGLGNLEEDTEDALRDAMQRNTYFDWLVAVFEDHLYWGYFHDLVEADIRNKVKRMEANELILTKGGKKNKGKPGRADLYATAIGKDAIYLWEVKPKSYEEKPNKKRGGGAIKRVCRR